MKHVLPWVIFIVLIRTVAAADAQWIWDSEGAQARNYFLMVRKTVDVPEAPDSAVLHITASDRYVLYINGEYTGRGPARGEPRWKSFDSYSIGEKLKPGRNVVAVLAYHYGQSDYPKLYLGNAYATGERAGLWAKLKIAAGGKSTVISTGPDWRVRPAAGWKRDVTAINPLVGFPEVYDARRDPVDWTATNFDDSAWQPAVPVAEADCPWKSLEPRDVPMMRETEVFPSEIVKTGETTDIDGGDVYSRFVKEVHLPLSVAVLDSPEMVLAHDGRAYRAQAVAGPNKEIRQPFVIIDFGRQVFGFPVVRMKAPEGAVIDMFPAQQFLGGRVDKTGDVMRLGDRYIARAGQQTWQTFEYRQFRYLQLAIRTTEPVEIESVSVNAYQSPAEQRGQFECSDPVLNRVWRACIRTVNLQMEDILAIDAWRERVNWASLDVLEGIIAAYGDTAVVRRHFRAIARGAFEDGRLPDFGPPKQIITAPDWIPQIPLIWLAQADFYYQYTGDQKFLGELYPAAKRGLDWYHGIENEDGLIDISKTPHWNMVDWSPVDVRGACLASNAMYLAALEAGVDMARAMNDPESAARWSQRADAVRTKLQGYWNEKRGLFEDTFFNGRFTGRFSELGNALALQHGVAKPRQAARVISEFCVKTPADVAKPTPIYISMVFWPLARAGGLEKVLELVRGRYPSMVTDDGVGTIWELWPEDYFKTKGVASRSVVHGGGAPALLFAEEVLGIRSVGRGFKECRVEVPNLQSVTWAKGVLPSVRGDIAVNWRRDGRQWTIEVDLPADLKTRIALPKEIPWRSVALDGKDARADELVVVGGKHRVQAVSDSPNN